MTIAAAFAIPEQVRAETLLFEGGGVTVLASTRGTAGRCLLCGHTSRRPHSAGHRSADGTAQPTGGTIGASQVSFRAAVGASCSGQHRSNDRAFPTGSAFDLLDEIAQWDAASG